MPGRRRLIGAIAVATLALAGCTGGPPCRLVLATRIPLVVMAEDPRVMVPVKIDRRPARLLLDTGSDTTLLTDAAFRRLSALEHPQQERTLSGIGGLQLAAGTALWRFSLGVLANELSIAVIDHSILPPIPPTDGLLGMDAVAGFDLDLDMASNTIGLYRAEGDCHAPLTRLTGDTRAIPLLPPVGPNPKPRFAATVNGHALVAEIDTGAPTTVLFARGAATLGLAATATPDHVHGIGPGAAVAGQITLDRIKVGPFLMRNRPATLLDQNVADPVDLLLGMDFVRMLHVWYFRLRPAPGTAIPTARHAAGTVMLADMASASSARQASGTPSLGYSVWPMEPSARLLFAIDAAKVACRSLQRPARRRGSA